MNSQKTKSFKKPNAASKQQKKGKVTPAEKQKEAPKPEPEVETVFGIACNLRQVDKVLLEDTDGQIKKSGRWPLLIDPSGQAVTFLKYRDTNYLCTANSKDMVPETVRKALIGSIRFGKPFLVDMMDTDMFHIIEKTINEILPNLMTDLMNKNIMKDNKYIELVKPEDGPMYDDFDPMRLDSFIFILATKNESPPASLLNIMFPVRVQ